MAINFLEKRELDDQSVEFNNNKFGVKLKPTGGILKSDEGLEVQFPAADVSVADVTVDGNNLKLTKTDGTEETRALPAQQVDVKISGLTFVDGKLKGTLSDGSEVETDFNAEIVISALENANAAQKTRLVNVFKELLKGEEVQDFAGVTKGFLLPA